MERSGLNEIFSRYLSHTASEQDMQALFEHFRTSDEPALRALIRDVLNAEEPADSRHQEKLEFLYAQIQHKIQRPKTRRLWTRVAAAAAILLIVSIGVYVYTNHPAKHAPLLAKNDIAPGGNTAILTLSDGRKIVLNNKSGTIATQAGKQVNIAANGAVRYNGKSTTTETLYNTLTVPIGNRRDLELPDGSKVSLDAGSSITYPVVFEKERRISMTGQAYFAVKHDEKHPFKINVKGQDIEDIGTEFNISAYDDEPAVKTTLIAGSVKVNSTIIKPGEQAQSKDNNTVVKAADIESVTAWKDNNFLFRNQSLKTSMRQIARWYNVSVVYNNVNDKLRIYVDVSRTRNLSVILKAIEATGKVKCSLEGRTITLNEPD